MRRIRTSVVLTGCIACLLLAWALWPGTTTSSQGGELTSPLADSDAAGEPAPATMGPPALAAAPAPPSPAGDPALGRREPSGRVPAAQLAAIQADETLRERARQQALAVRADARWHEAVDDSGYTARDFDPAVRALFRDITLEPRYAEGGQIEGLVIEDMVAEHPLARLGFRRGDRIDRIQGVSLRDPRDIPSLLAHLGPHFELCADREGSPYCRDVVLD